MKVSRPLLFLVLVAVFTFAPFASAQSQCPTPSCTVGGGPTCNQYIPNPELVHGCGWNVASTAGYVDVNSLNRTLYTTPDIQIPANENGDLELYFYVDINNPSAGTENLRIELVQGSTYTHIGRVDPEGPAGERRIMLSDSWKGQSFRVRFRWAPGINPGSTSYRIQQAYLFAVAQ